jgi:hypothetical protein
LGDLDSENRVSASEAEVEAEVSQAPKNPKKPLPKALKIRLLKKQRQTKARTNRGRPRKQQDGEKFILKRLQIQNTDTVLESVDKFTAIKQRRSNVSSGESNSSLSSVKKEPEISGSSLTVVVQDVNDNEVRELPAIDEGRTINSSTIVMKREKADQRKRKKRPRPKKKKKNSWNRMTRSNVKEEENHSDDSMETKSQDEVEEPEKPQVQKAKKRQKKPRAKAAAKNRKKVWATRSKKQKVEENLEEANGDQTSENSHEASTVLNETLEGSASYSFDGETFESFVATCTIDDEIDKMGQEAEDQAMPEVQPEPAENPLEVVELPKPVEVTPNIPAAYLTPLPYDSELPADVTPEENFISAEKLLLPPRPTSVPSLDAIDEPSLDVLDEPKDNFEYHKRLYNIRDCCISLEVIPQAKLDKIISKISSPSVKITKSGRIAKRSVVYDPSPEPKRARKSKKNSKNDERIEVDWIRTDDENEEMKRVDETEGEKTEEKSPRRTKKRKSEEREQSKSPTKKPRKSDDPLKSPEQVKSPKKLRMFRWFSSTLTTFQTCWISPKTTSTSRRALKVKITDFPAFQSLQPSPSFPDKATSKDVELEPPAVDKIATIEVEFIGHTNRYKGKAVFGRNFSQRILPRFTPVRRFVS